MLIGLDEKIDQVRNPGTSKVEQAWSREAAKKEARKRKGRRRRAGTEGEGEGEEEGAEGGEDALETKEVPVGECKSTAEK